MQSERDGSGAVEYMYWNSRSSLERGMPPPMSDSCKEKRKPGESPTLCKALPSESSLDLCLAAVRKRLNHQVSHQSNARQSLATSVWIYIQQLSGKGQTIRQVTDVMSRKCSLDLCSTAVRKRSNHQVNYQLQARLC